ncbi:T9SS type A sorting domain-containing protein [Maribacter sp. 2308TA10-17]|uniref:T9SS type A sorting domain-containing protein n=1 Tax=Maribacter sp. 2308TA10-17 TaxID=3386276 RepID=UPI0039BCBBF5
MRKILILFILILTPFAFAIAQNPPEYTYKVELSYRFENLGFTERGFVAIPYNGTNTPLGPALISVDFFGPGTKTVTVDDVITYSREITNFQYRSFGDTSCTPPFGGGPQFTSFSGSECTFVNIGFSTCISVNPASFPNLNKLFLVENFADLNPGQNAIKECEGKQIIISSHCGFRYSLVAIYNGVRTPILEYGEHPRVYQLQKSDLPSNIGNNVFDLQVEYVDNPNLNVGSTDVSVRRSYNFTACAPELDGPPVITNPTCFEATDGSANITLVDDFPTGEQMAISLLRKVGNAYVPVTEVPQVTVTETNFTNRSYTYNFNGRTPTGTYILRFLFGNNGDDQRDSAEFPITEPSALNFAETVNNTSCEGTVDGSIEVTPQGGTGPYTYFLTPDGGSETTYSTSTIPTLASGNYSLRIRDANMCFSTSKDITIQADSSSPELDLFDTVTNQFDTFPFGEARITLGTISGGDGNYAFSWTRIPDNGFAETTRNLTNLTEGEYTVVITEDNGAGCESIPYSFTINPFTALSVTLDNPSPDCIDGQVLVTATAVNGVGTYLYRWFRIDPINGEELIPGETGSTIFVPVGEYKVEVTDGGSAMDTATTIISVDNPLTVTESNITDALCAGESSGRITLNISGGATPYRIFWDGSNNQGLQDNTTLAAGDHTYEVFDANDCSVTGGPITIGEPTNSLEVTGVKIDVTTNMGSDGVITLTIINGTAPFQFNWGKLDADGVNYSPYSPVQGANPLQFTGFVEGTYQVTVTDGTANACTATLVNPITITEPGPLNITDVQIQEEISCFGQMDGEIVATVTGTSPITFEWRLNGVPFRTLIDDNVLTGLGPGDYQLFLNDGSLPNPRESAIITLAPVSEILITPPNITPVSCNLGSDGSITVNASGGTGALRYQITGRAIQPSPLFENLFAGTYSVTVFDSNDCSSTPFDVEVPEPTSLQITGETITPVTTFGGNDGAITIVVEGGNLPYTYEWTGPNGYTNDIQNLENLESGLYSVVIRSVGNGGGIDNCFFARSFEVPEPGALSVTIADQQNPCFGETNGSITASIAGTGPYTLQWSDASGPLAGETGLTLTNIGEGTYTLNVIDLGSMPNAVGSSTPVLLVEPQEITADINTTPSCTDNDTGTIIISNVQGGEPDNLQDYTYSLDGMDFQNPPLFENLAPATYSVWIRDGNGCDLIRSGITVDTSPEIIFDEPNTIVTNAGAQNASDGSITLAFTSDATNYTYQWNGPGTVNETTQNLVGKAAGVYTVNVTNENGCSLERIFTIAEPGLLEITVTGSKNPCFGENNGSIQTTVNGTGNLSLQWSEAVRGDLIGETNENLNNAPQGTYTLTVTDNAVNPPNIVASVPVTLSDPAAILDAQAIPTDAQCAGEANGAVTINASGGIPPYEYSIDAGITYQAQATFNDLGLGTYSIRVRDSNDCIADAPFTINEPPVITLSSTATPLSAAGSADGAIDIAASGGTGNLSFSWEGPPGFTPTTNEDISGLTAGDYTVTVTDENDCTFISNPITIDEPGAIIIMLTINEEILCNGDEFGEIMADVQGGVPDYTYQWFQEGNNTPLAETTNLLSNLSAGNYFLRVTDANGIVRDSNTIPLTEPSDLEATLQNKIDIVCSGEASGSINISVLGGTLPYTFQWSNGATSRNLANVEAGDYFVEVFDNNGCFDLLEVTINPAPDALQIDATVFNTSEYLANDGSIALDITGGAAPYTINWTRDSDNTPLGDTVTISSLSADTYTVSVSDTNGCSVTETYEVTQPDIVEDTIVQPSCQGDTNGSISVIVNQGNGSFTYLWSTGETTNTITNLGAGEYSVTITGFGNGPLTRTYTLIDPLPLEVDLGSNRVLCVDQVLELDATVEDETATYAWTSDTGFSSSSPNVTLNATGNYTVTVQTASGCTAVGTLSLEVSTDEIDAEFALSSQVFTGEVLVAVDISFPLPEVIEWQVPEGATVVKQDSDEVEMIFDQAGEYEITIVTKRGDCIAQKTKKVLVVAKDGSVNQDDDPSRLVEDFIIYPNPTTGRFTADVSLTERGNISIKVFNFANNALMASERGTGDSSYSIPFDISGMPTGVYAVLLETPYGTSLQKIIVR